MLLNSQPVALSHFRYNFGNGFSSRGVAGATTGACCGVEAAGTGLATIGLLLCADLPACFAVASAFTSSTAAGGGSGASTAAGAATGATGGGTAAAGATGATAAGAATGVVPLP